MLDKLLDRFVGEQLHGFTNGKTERLSRLNIDDQLEFRGLLDWQIGRVRPFRDPVDTSFRATTTLALRSPLRFASRSR